MCLRTKGHRHQSELLKMRYHCAATTLFINLPIQKTIKHKAVNQKIEFTRISHRDFE